MINGIRYVFGNIFKIILFKTVVKIISTEVSEIEIITKRSI